MAPSPVYPEGDGLSDCPACRGRGAVPLSREERPKFAIGEITRPCVCVYERDIQANAERGWRALGPVDPVPGPSPLEGRAGANLWVTASEHAFKAHLRYLIGRMGPRWNFLVASDADLMDSWLSRDLDVIDADVGHMRRSAVSNKYAALVDLVEPPVLLILHLGIKIARNEAMPEVLLEALKHRFYIDKPTWVFDQPTALFASGHRAFSVTAKEHMAKWPHLTFQKAGAAPAHAIRLKSEELLEGLTPILGTTTETVTKDEPEPAPPATHGELADVVRTKDDRLAEARRKTKRLWKGDRK